MLTALALILGAALVCGALARMLGFPAMAGELVAGVLLGPSVLGFVAPRVTGLVVDSDGTPTTAVSAVATLAVVLLVGLAATELDAQFLRGHARTIGVVGAVSFVVPLAAGVALGFVLPARYIGQAASTTAFAVLLGVAMSVSAIPVIARILGDLDLLRSTLGRLILSVGTLTDLAAWVMLAAVSALVTVGLRGWHLPLTLLAMIGSIAVAVILRPLIGRVLTRLETAGHDAQSAAVMVIAMVAGAAATDAMHLEAVLGALLAGIACGRRPERVVAPLRIVTTSVLAPVFLASAGLHVDLRTLGGSDGGGCRGRCDRGGRIGKAPRWIPRSTPRPTVEMGFAGGRQWPERTRSGRDHHCDNRIEFGHLQRGDLHDHRRDGRGDLGDGRPDGCCGSQTSPAGDSPFDPRRRLSLLPPARAGRHAAGDRRSVRPPRLREHGARCGIWPWSRPVRRRGRSRRRFLLRPRSSHRLSSNRVRHIGSQQAILRRLR